MWDKDIDEEQEKQQALLDAIRKHIPELEQWLEEQNGSETYEDGVYRFYHMSFKVYNLQADTLKAVEVFRTISQRVNKPLTKWFEEIIAQGTGKEFEMDHNRNWSFHTRPIVEAYMHTKYFVEMMVNAAHKMSSSPESIVISSGWAAILTLYELR
jgi:hypothetical protein